MIESSTGTKSNINFEKRFQFWKKIDLQAKKSESWGEKKPFEWRNSGHSSDSSSETDPKVGNFIQRIVDAHDLGQHGGKLLLELSSSVFAPTMVVGCICMGTEVY